MSILPIWLKAIELDNVDGTVNEIILALQQWAIDCRRRGAVIGVSGGVDSAVTLALCVRAFGKKDTLAVLLPDKDSDPSSARLAESLAEELQVNIVRQDITHQLEACEAYRMRDEAASEVFPDYDPKFDRLRVEYSNNLEQVHELPLFCLSLVKGEGHVETRYLRPGPYLKIVAATNLKQRSRMMVLYLLAEQRFFGVIGTANRLEAEQGFFVKHGDGAADIFPLDKLYKTQVYQLAERLKISNEIIERPPTTDTYSADQTQEQFFFSLPSREADILWSAFCHDIESSVVGTTINLSADAVDKVFEGFRRRCDYTRYLRSPHSEGS
jgi:NAD+ synthase